MPDDSKPVRDGNLGGLSCGEVLELLPEFVEGALVPPLLDQVLQHVEGCDACRRFGGRYGRVVSLLRAGGSALGPLDEELKERLGRALERS